MLVMRLHHSSSQCSRPYVHSSSNPFPPLIVFCIDLSRIDAVSGNALCDRTGRLRDSMSFESRRRPSRWCDLSSVGSSRVRNRTKVAGWMTSETSLWSTIFRRTRLRNSGSQTTVDIGMIQSADAGSTRPPCSNVWNIARSSLRRRFFLFG